MSLIHAQELEKSFGERTLFSNIAFDVFEQDHVGLVGVNGCGKSTLMRMIAGLEPHDGRGQLSVSKNANVAMLDQSPNWGNGQTLYEAVLEASGKWMRAERELHEIAQKIEEQGASETLIRERTVLQDRYTQDGGLTYRAYALHVMILRIPVKKRSSIRQISVMSGGQTSLAKSCFPTQICC
ncbi:MAG: ATP-binding cassette domain-containing protein [Eubacteriales bacterium]